MLAEELAARGTTVDGVMICPAYIEPGRVTVDSLHWSRTNDGMIPVAHSEFAKDASFGYLNSDLRDWVEEKTEGRISRDDVAAITLTDIREGGPDRVEEILTGLSNGQPVVVDAADYADLSGGRRRAAAGRVGRQELRLPDRPVVRPVPQRPAGHAGDRRRPPDGDPGRGAARRR